LKNVGKIIMGSVSGKMGYEFKNKGSRVEKSVATEVEAVSSEELEKSVAEEVKVVDPVDAEAVIAKAKADADKAKAEAAKKEKAKADAAAKLEKEKQEAKKEVVDGGTEDPAVPKEDIKEPQ
jgi:hypothetical protein